MEPESGSISRVASVMETQQQRGLNRGHLIGISLFVLCGLTLLSHNQIIGGLNYGTTACEKARVLPTISSNAYDFDIAKRESLGFFDDIPSQTWLRMKDKVKDMSPNFNKFYLPFTEGRTDRRVKKPGNFYQNNYEPDFVCQHEKRIGRLGDGGKWICDPHRITDQEDCLVYSVGSNNDFSFEQSVLDKIGHHCEIHTVSVCHCMILFQQSRVHHDEYSL